MTKIFLFLSLILCTSLLTYEASAQDRPTQPPAPAPTPTKLAESFTVKLNSLPTGFEAKREDRQKAYAKLLEGQRYIWRVRRISQRLSIQSGVRLAREALIKAIEFNPKLAEAYTALAELSVAMPPQDIEEAIKLSKIATSLDNDNLGGHKLLARLYSAKSNIGRTKLNEEFADPAIKEWLEITRLDPRDAEAWAILSSFYEEKGDTEKQISALKNWQSSATPLDVGFYSSIMIREGELTIENAALKLGEALLENGKNKEALSVLTRAVAVSPRSLDAVDLLSQALENFEGDDLLPAVEALRQAVFTNPDNISLNKLLAQTISRSGNIDDAIKFLKNSVIKFSSKDIGTASNLQVSLGDLYVESNRTDEAIESYKTALKIRGIETKELTSEDEREFAMLVVNKMINAYKLANRLVEAKNIVNEYQVLFGDRDTSLQRELVEVLRTNGKKADALQVLRSIRETYPLDYSLIRTEALILTELGRVEEGIAIIQKLIDEKPQNVTPSVMYIDYNNYLYITALYLQANKTDDAITVAYKAVDIAKDKEERQIAKLTLASAIQSAGNFIKAEEILNKILQESPNNPIALNNLGYLFLESDKNYELALKLINKAVLVDPRNPQYLDSLGWAYFKLKKYAEAEKYLIKAIKYDATSSTIFEHLGDVYKQTGKIDQALANWKKALDLSSNSKDKSRIETKIKE